MTDPVFEIISRYEEGESFDSFTADDSAEIKGFIRENGVDHPVSEKLARYFPLEADEVWMESGDGELERREDA